jgi:hypothetical protein
MAHDVFISHAHKDKGIAETICEKLESAQVRCWIAERDISAGEDWTEATRNAIGSSRAMVLVFSENANAAPHIEREIAHAFYTKRTIIPLRLTNTLPRRDFLFYLGNVRWFDAFSSPAEEQLEALTARINGMVQRRTVTGDAMPAKSAIRTMRALNPSDSWIGALRASHFRTLEILKRVVIAASLAAVMCLLWFVPWHTSDDASPPPDGHLHSRFSGPRTSLDSVPQGTRDAAVSKPPTYTYTRFGLWVAPNTDPTPSVQQGLRHTPSPQSDLDQKAAGNAESLAAQDSVSANSAQEEPTQINDRRERHRAKSRSKAHHARGSASEGLRFAEIRGRLRALWHQFVARSNNQ